MRLDDSKTSNHQNSQQRIDASNGDELAGLDLYFIDADGGTFKTTMLHQPYFYVLTRKEDETLGQLLMKKFAGSLAHVEQVPMVDLDQPNHLSPNQSTRLVWKLLFHNVSNLMDVRSQLQDVLKKSNKHSRSNGGNNEGTDAAVMDIETLLERNGNPNHHTFRDSNHVADSWANIQELREYDVPYVVRVCMDLNIRAGSWYTVTLEHVDDDGSPPRPVLSDADIETKGNPRVLAFDIECSKAPLKFPNADMDEIYMISYMCSDGKGTPKGYLITSRSIVSEDVSDFEYTPKPSYPGPFHIFNEADELSLIRRFIEEFRTYRPQIVVTYNGDSFDWPFLFARAAKHRIDLWKEIGMNMMGGDRGSDAVMSGGEVRGRCCVHLDAFCWVQRDSYLPQGAQGLKAVTKYKLGYDPVEVDPEDMLPMAQERPIHMATYSVSDAVATYYLYEKYVHLFIFSLCTLIPMGPEDVLRKGSGTLCETLLMVQANDKDIICPNKQVDPLAKFHKGHLLESETYIGGKVECLETGVYRSDVEYDFDLKPSAFQQLIDNIDRDLCFAIEVEAGKDRSDITNYEEVRSKIVEQLELLRDRPKRVERPYIYHLDVGAMYPNM
jgi:DNA polymerase epsilon subunit 1